MWQPLASGGDRGAGDDFALSESASRQTLRLLGSDEPQAIPRLRYGVGLDPSDRTSNHWLAPGTVSSRRVFADTRGLRVF